MAINNRELFKKARALNFESNPSLVTFVLNKKGIEVIDDIDSLEIDLFLQNFLKLARKKWSESGRHCKVMERKFGGEGGWLSQDSTIPNILLTSTPSKSTPKKSAPSKQTPSKPLLLKYALIRNDKTKKHFYAASHGDNGT